jgi:hypothetical protein
MSIKYRAMSHRSNYSTGKARPREDTVQINKSQRKTTTKKMRSL